MNFLKVSILITWLFGFVTEAKLDSDLMSQYDAVKTDKILTGHDVVTATINGVTGKFVLDTGAVTVINDKLIEKYGLKEKIKTFDAAGAAGPIKISYYAIESLHIGPAHLNIGQIGVTDLNQVIGGIYNVTSIKVDGIIGQDVFVNAQAVLNLSDHTISFPKNLTKTAASLSAQLSGDGYLPIDLMQVNFEEIGFMFHALNLEINGVKKLFILDSGASRTMIDKASLSGFNFNAGQGPITGTSGAGGSFTIEKLDVDELKIEDNFVDIDVVYGIDISPLIKFIKDQANTDVYGVIGQDILSPLNAVIDSRDNKLYLKFE